MDCLPKGGKGLAPDQAAGEEAEVDTFHYQLCGLIFI